MKIWLAFLIGFISLSQATKTVRFASRVEINSLLPKPPIGNVSHREDVSDSWDRTLNFVSARKNKEIPSRNGVRKSSLKVNRFVTRTEPFVSEPRFSSTKTKPIGPIVQQAWTNIFLSPSTTSQNFQIPQPNIFLLSVFTTYKKIEDEMSFVFDKSMIEILIGKLREHNQSINEKTIDRLLIQIPFSNIVRPLNSIEREQVHWYSGVARRNLYWKVVGITGYIIFVLSCALYFDWRK